MIYQVCNADALLPPVQDSIVARRLGFLESDEANLK